MLNHQSSYWKLTLTANCLYMNLYDNIVVTTVNLSRILKIIENSNSSSLLVQTLDIICLIISK